MTENPSNSTEIRHTETDKTNTDNLDTDNEVEQLFNEPLAKGLIDKGLKEYSQFILDISDYSVLSGLVIDNPNQVVLQEKIAGF